MKKQLLTKSILLALACSAGSVAATETTFSMNGYIKSGILMNSDGTRAQSLNPLQQGSSKWRLGNEQNTKIELLPTVTMVSEDGVIARVRANLTHETVCTADWNCGNSDDGDSPIHFREGYAEIENVAFAPDVVWWAGRRYSSSNTSNHQYDWEYIQYNGTGGGFDKVDLGWARFDFGLYAFTPSGENYAAPADPTKQGYSEDYSVNAWLKNIAGSGFDFQVVAHHMELSEWRADNEAATGGFGVTAVYNFDGFYQFANGYSRAVFQYGEGLAAGDSLGKNGWGWANRDETRSWRAVLDGLASFGDIEVSTFAYYQADKDYHDNKWDGRKNDVNRWAIGARPFHQIARNFAMQYELGYEYYDNTTTGMSGGMTKATIAPTITFESGFWTRPQLRAFVTAAKWDEAINERMHESYVRNGQTDALNFGVQAEVWF